MKMRNLKAKRRTRLRGFSIAEMLMVVLIIGLIASSGTGLYVGTFKKLRVKRAAHDFFLTAQYARIMASKNKSRNVLLLMDDCLGYTGTKRPRGVAPKVVVVNGAVDALFIVEGLNRYGVRAERLTQ